MKHKLGIYLLFFFVAIVTNAQYYEYYPYEDTKDFITASADNYFPKLNEPVKVKLKITSPWNIKSTIGFFMPFGNEGIEIIEGEKTRNLEIKKDQTIEMEITLKFTKKMVNRIQATFTKNVYVLLPFYIDGAFRKSAEVKAIQEEIATLNQWIKETNDGKNLKYIGIGEFFDPKKTIDHNIFTLTDYDKSILEENKKRNVKLFKVLKKEYDSLYIITQKLSRENKFRVNKTSELNKNSNDSSSKINLYKFDLPPKKKSR